MIKFFISGLLCLVSLSVYADNTTPLPAAAATAANTPASASAQVTISPSSGELKQVKALFKNTDYDDLDDIRNNQPLQVANP